LEIVEQLRQQDVVPDLFVLNCSGGGLASGVTEVVREAFPHVDIVLAEIEGFEKMARSLAIGPPQRNPSVPATVLDGIAGPDAGVLALEVLRRHQVRGVGVSDQEGIQGMQAAFQFLKLVVEPAGAAALGAVLAKKLEVAGKQVVVIATGGNVDPAVFAT